MLWSWPGSTRARSRLHITFVTVSQRTTAAALQPPVAHVLGTHIQEGRHSEGHIIWKAYRPIIRRSTHHFEGLVPHPLAYLYLFWVISYSVFAISTLDVLPAAPPFSSRISLLRIPFFSLYFLPN
jgi:hypothetical protein